MKVHCNEGVATRIDPEPCVFGREGKDEASVRECIGQPWSRENSLISGADVVTNAEGNMGRGDSASPSLARRGQRPWHVRTLFARNREISGLTCG